MEFEKKAEEVEEVLRSEREEVCAGLSVSLTYECDIRERLEGMMLLINSNLENVIPVTRKVLDSSQDRHTSKFWDVYHIMQNLITANEFQENSHKIDEPQDETEALARLLDRSKEVQEFFSADSLATYFQTLPMVCQDEEKPESEEEQMIINESEVDLSDCETSEEETKRRNTFGNFTAKDDQKDEISSEVMSESPSKRRKTWGGHPVWTKKPSEAMPKSSLIVTEDDKGLMVIGRGAVMQPHPRAAGNEEVSQTSPFPVSPSKETENIEE